jgi:hypothetical protein
MGMKVDLQAMDPDRISVDCFTFESTPFAPRAPWVSLDIRVGSEEIDILTTRPELLEAIAKKCTELAFWLRMQDPIPTGARIAE